jgi:hypothetical protein
VVFSDESAQAAVDFNNSMETMNTALNGLKDVIATIAAPAFEVIIGKITDLITHVSDFVKDNPAFIKALEDIGVKLLVGGAIIGGLSLMYTWIGKIITAVVALVAMTPGGWATIAAGIAAATAGIIAVNKLLNTSEIGRISSTTRQKLATPEGQAVLEEKGSERQKELYLGMTPEDTSPNVWPEGYPGWFNNPSLTFMKEEYPSGVKNPPWAPVGDHVYMPEAFGPKGNWRWVKQYYYGGTVPGPIGQPQLAIVHGGEQFAGVGNTLSYGGFNSSSFQGISQALGGGQSLFQEGSNMISNIGRPITNNFILNGNVMDESNLRHFAREINRILGEEGRRSMFHGVNPSFGYGNHSQ